MSIETISSNFKKSKLNHNDPAYIRNMLQYDVHTAVEYNVVRPIFNVTYCTYVLMPIFCFLFSLMYRVIRNLKPVFYSGSGFNGPQIGTRTPLTSF